MIYTPTIHKNIHEKWTRVDTTDTFRSLEARKWCNDQQSPGKYDYFTHGWYFEFEEDAMWFNLQGF